MNALLYAISLLFNTSTANLFAGEALTTLPKTQLTGSSQTATPAEKRSTGTNDKAIPKEGGPLPKDALLPGKPAHSYVIVPPDWEKGSLSLRDGCWAKVYDEDGFNGDGLTILGPISIPDMGGGMFGIAWKDRISNIETGERAQMTLYDNAEQKDALFTIQPGQKLNVNNAIQGFREIRSLRITCQKS